MKKNMFKGISLALAVAFIGMGAGHTTAQAAEASVPEAMVQEILAEEIAVQETAATELDGMVSEETIDVEGMAGANIGEIITEEGVSVAPIKAARGFGINTAGMMDMTPIQFNIDRTLGNGGSIQGNITMLPALEYGLKLDFEGLHELKLVQRGKLELSDLYINCDEAGVITVATIPYTFGEGRFTAYVTLQLVYSASGEGYLTYGMDGGFGVNYDGEAVNFVCDYNPQELMYGLDGYAEVGAKLGMKLVAYGMYTLMDTEVNAGIGTEIQVQDTEEAVNYASLYFYLNGNYGYNSVLKEYGVYGDTVVFDKTNSPLQYEIVF